MDEIGSCVLVTHPFAGNRIRARNEWPMDGNELSNLHWQTDELLRRPSLDAFFCWADSKARAEALSMLIEMWKINFGA